MAKKLSKPLSTLKDWFGRRAEDSYTFYDKNARTLNWDRGATSLTAVVLGSKNPKRLREISKVLQTMFRMIGVPKKARLVARPATKPTEIYVPMHLLKDLDTGEYTLDSGQVDSFVGQCLVNAATCAFQTNAEYKNSLENMRTEQGVFNLERYVFTLLNQERVSLALSKKNPGYMRFVQKAKDEQFDLKYEPLDENAPQHLRFLDLLTRLIRFPKYATDEELYEFQQPLEQIGRLLKKHNGLPENQSGIKSMSKALTKVLLDFTPAPPPMKLNLKPAEGEVDPDQPREELNSTDEAEANGQEMDVDAQMVEGEEDGEKENNPQQLWNQPEINAGDLDDASSDPVQNSRNLEPDGELDDSVLEEEDEQPSAPQTGGGAYENDDDDFQDDFEDEEPEPPMAQDDTTPDINLDIQPPLGSGAPDDFEEEDGELEDDVLEEEEDLSDYPGENGPQNELDPLGGPTTGAPEFEEPEPEQPSMFDEWGDSNPTPAAAPEQQDEEEPDLSDDFESEEKDELLPAPEIKNGVAAEIEDNLDEAQQVKSSQSGKDVTLEDDDDEDFVPAPSREEELTARAQDLAERLLDGNTQPDGMEQDNVPGQLSDAQAALDELFHRKPPTAEEKFEEDLDHTGQDDKSSDYVSWTITKHKDKHSEEYKQVVQELDMTKAKVIQTLFKRKRQEHEFVVKGMKSGRFDDNKIAEAKQGVQNVYVKSGKVTTDNLCVIVLCDESGSMGGYRIRMARQAAIFLNECFSKVPGVEFFVYGHSADEKTNNRAGQETSTDMYVYREPGHRCHPHAIGAMKSRNINRDGKAIMLTAMRVRKFTPNKGVFIVISDGSPSGYDSMQLGVDETRRQVKLVEKMGFDVVQVAIDAGVRSDEMFTHFVQMLDISTLPRDLVRFMSKRLGRMMQSKTTL